MNEYFFTCPYCWEKISMLLDPYMEDDDYVEDCQVCCRPIVVNFRIVDDEVVSFSSNVIDGNG
ncbi:MAG: CPXCG motif-containing cysteine-rich protein [Campylobacterota bacterium]|nr:CPXCG motif-containing cysteine-rich protein [Campylobacterota bacterium]